VAWLTNEAGRLRPSPFWCGVWRLALSQQFDHAYRPVKREEVLRENDNFSLLTRHAECDPTGCRQTESL
jgi:hypothetical protein